MLQQSIPVRYRQKIELETYFVHHFSVYMHTRTVHIIRREIHVFQIQTHIWECNTIIPNGTLPKKYMQNNRYISLSWNLSDPYDFEICLFMTFQKRNTPQDGQEKSLFFFRTAKFNNLMFKLWKRNAIFAWLSLSVVAIAVNIITSGISYIHCFIKWNEGLELLEFFLLIKTNVKC